MSKYTKYQAEVICKRTLPEYIPMGKILSCKDCYHYDSSCELFIRENDGIAKCSFFKEDNRTTNMVRKKILYDKDWCVRNWDFMCRVDRELFSAIYGCTVWKSR